MKKAPILVTNLVALSLIFGCGSMDVDEYIQRYSEAFCKKYDECLTQKEKDDAAPVLGYSNYDECMATLIKQQKESKEYQAIQDGTCEFNADKAETCVDHYEKTLTCDHLKGKEVFQEDPSCKEVLSGSDPVCDQTK